MHQPVLLQEAVDGLNIIPGGLYIDATAGEGGHLREIAKRGGKVLGIDRDKKQISNLKDQISKIENAKNIRLVQGNFADIEKIAKDNHFFHADGILFDLGLSMQQLEGSGKGFSYLKLGDPLDMRLDPTKETTAADLISHLNQNEIYELLAKYGEEIRALAISKTLVRARTLKPIEKVGDLIAVVDQVAETKGTKTYARVFQALRIVVNDEFENLKKALAGATRLVGKTGRIVVITFHSLEDRIVKQFVRNNQLNQINKKVITSDKGSFMRSAKLRIISMPS